MQPPQAQHSVKWVFNRRLSPQINMKMQLNNLLSGNAKEILNTSTHRCIALNSFEMIQPFQKYAAGSCLVWETHVTIAETKCTELVCNHVREIIRKSHKFGPCVVRAEPADLKPPSSLWNVRIPYAAREVNARCSKRDRKNISYGNESSKQFDACILFQCHLVHIILP